MAPRQTYTDRDYFEEKFGNIEDQILHLTKIIEGNGKPGLIDKVQNLEDRYSGIKMWIGGASAVITVVVGTIGIIWWRYGAPFIEQVEAHVHAR